MTDQTTPRVASGWRTIPNLLTLARFVGTPVLGWLIVRHHTNWATGLLGAMGVSDYFDGYIARRTNTVTDLGTTLDPVSDRVLIMTALVTMMLARILPFWLGIPVMVREAGLSLVFIGLARRGFGRPRVRRIGKTATFALLMALPALLLGGVLRPVGIVLFVLGALAYAIATYRYYVDVRRFLDEQRRPFA